MKGGEKMKLESCDVCSSKVQFYKLTTLTNKRAELSIKICPKCDETRKYISNFFKAGSEPFNPIKCKSCGQPIRNLKIVAN
jgi:hypothetical protein